MRTSGSVSKKRAEIRPFFLAAALALAGCATSPPDPCRRAYMGQTPLWHIANRLIVPVTIDGHAIPMLFDTGGAVSIIPPQHAAALGLQPQANPPKLTPQITGLGGTRTAKIMTAATIAIGALSATNIAFLVPNDDAVRLTSHFPETLGMNFLTSFDLDLDFAHNRLVFYRPAGFCPVPRVPLRPPLYTAPILPDRADDRPIVPATIEGQPVRALLDTGSPQSLMFRDTAARLGLSPEALAAEPHQFLTGIGPTQIRAARHRTTAIEIGGLRIGGLRLYVSPETDPRLDLVLGMDILSRIHLWISHSSHQVILQYPPSP